MQNTFFINPLAVYGFDSEIPIIGNTQSIFFDPEIEDFMEHIDALERMYTKAVFCGYTYDPTDMD